MNLTTGNAKVNARKNVRAQYIAAALGLAVAVSALTAIATWRDGGTATPVPARASISAPQSEQAPNNRVVFIAGSQQQASDHAASIYQDLNPASFGSYSFVVVTNAEEEAKVLETARELLEIGVNFQVIDLRGN